MQKKSNIFGKIALKDYTSELEKIFEYKRFSETSKSYLLSMMYKIENSYKDYENVKRFVQDKDKFIENILYIIEKKCNKINITKLKDLDKIKNEDLIKINYEKGIIDVIPNEELLLKALTRLDYFHWEYSKQKILMERPINNFLNMGVSQNIVEEIRNFDGWAWNNSVTKENKAELLSHIVYNNLIMIYGRELVQNWLYTDMSCENYMKKLKNLLDRENGKEEIKIFFDSLVTLVTLIFMNSENKKEYIKALKEQENEIISSRKNRKSVSEVNNKSNIKRSTKEKYEYLKSLSLNKRINIALSEAFINFEKNFLKLISLKLEKNKDKDSLINIIYLFRYYKFMPINKQTSIKDIPELKNQIEEIEKMIILKSINAKVLSGIGNIVDVNLRIYKKALFDTRIINLENILIESLKVENKLRINIYDGTILEDYLIINISEPKKFGIKVKKKIAIFS